MTDPSKETASTAHWPQMTGQAVSDYLGFSPQWLAKLVTQGFVQRRDDTGLFDGGDVCRGYIAWLKDADRRASKTETAKRKEAAQALKVEIDNAKALNELVDIETIEVAFSEMYTTLRTEIDSVPAGVTRDLAQRATIETLINGAFARCRATFEATRAHLRSGRPLLDGEEPGAP